MITRIEKNTIKKGNVLYTGIFSPASSGTKQQISDVVLDDGCNKITFTLNRSYYGLYVPKGLWREMGNFSTNSLALVLSSTGYDANDYIRDYDEFLNLKKDGKI